MGLDEKLRDDPDYYNIIIHPDYYNIIIHPIVVHISVSVFRQTITASQAAAIFNTNTRVALLQTAVVNSESAVLLMYITGCLQHIDCSSACIGCVKGSRRPR